MTDFDIDAVGDGWAERQIVDAHAETRYNQWYRNGPARVRTAGAVRHDGVNVMATPIIPVPPETPQLKRCPKCGELKPCEAFSRDRSRPDGLQHTCKACSAAYDAAYRAANAERIAERARAYYAANTEQCASWVYFIRVGDTCKIGVTTDVKKRLASLQTANPTTISLLVTIPGDKKIEHALHQRFAADRIHHEWFTFSPALVSYVEGLL